MEGPWKRTGREAVGRERRRTPEDGAAELGVRASITPTWAVRNQLRCRPFGRLLQWLGPAGAAAAILACGGGGTAVVVGPDNGSPPEDGSLRVDNRTPFAVEVAYLRTGEQDEAAVVRAVVGPGERQEVGGGTLGAGTELKLDLVLMVPPEQGLRVRRKASVTIDGDVEVILALEDPSDPFSLQVTVQEAGGV